MTKEELFEIIIDEPDVNAYKNAAARFDSLAKPIDGFGAFEKMICKIASDQRTDRPDISRKGLVIMIADNGVVEEGVSQTTPDVTGSVARLMGKRRSTVGVMTEGYPVDIIPIDVGTDSSGQIPGVIDCKAAHGTKNIAKECAMSEEECLAAVSAGIGAADMCKERGIKLVATGEMGIGNTTTSSALFCALSQSPATAVAGRGAGLDDEGLQIKTDVIERALRLHKLNNTHENALDREFVFNALKCVGGLDIAALAGLYTGCARNAITVVIDGFISAVAALTAYAWHPEVKGYILASHSGKERGCKGALDMLGLDPVIYADMALGEGTGAVMLFPLLDMVMSVYDNGTVFADTGIRQYERYDC